jgi:AhpD family alkylhydroperoxidase
MAENSLDAFAIQRAKLNALMQQYAGRDTKRFLSLDHQAYLDGELPAKTKELLGLVASLVLRCDDCVSYHLLQCHGCGVNTNELMETLHIGLIVGGSITIPHLRRAIAAWDDLTCGGATDAGLPGSITG